MNRVNVLITAASRRVGLVRAFRRAVEEFGGGRVITTDINALSPALYFGHRNHIVPLTTDPEYIPIVESICDVDGVDLIVPTIDDELPLFGRLRSRFEDLGIWVAASDERAAVVANDKFMTYQFAFEHGISAPRTRLARSFDYASVTYPVVVKPRFGRGSLHVFEARNERELRFFEGYVPDAVVQDYLAGIEFTVDVCSDFDGRVISVVPRERLVIRAGVSDRGVTRRNRVVMDFACHVAESMHLCGPSNIQCKWDGSEVGLIEVNPRFSGGIPLTIEAGADIPAWLVQMRAGRTVSPRIGQFQADLTMMSFEDSVFARSEQLRPVGRRAPRRYSRTRSTTAYVN
jgi:carbamoyl-phosphate synthase large subunit